MKIFLSGLILFFGKKKLLKFTRVILGFLFLCHTKISCESSFPDFLVFVFHPEEAVGCVCNCNY